MTKINVFTIIDLPTQSNLTKQMYKDVYQMFGIAKQQLVNQTKFTKFNT